VVAVSQKLREALDAIESGELDALILEGDPSDLEELRSLISTDPTINPNDRTKAIYAVGRWGDTASAPRITTVLPELDEIGTITAVDTLGRLGTPEAISAVAELAQHESPHVRKFVVEALGKSSSPEAQEKLIDIEARDPAKFVRDRAQKFIEQ
jgi:HEAT repeat protein